MPRRLPLPKCCAPADEVGARRRLGSKRGGKGGLSQPGWLIETSLNGKSDPNGRLLTTRRRISFHFHRSFFSHLDLLPLPLQIQAPYYPSRASHRENATIARALTQASAAFFNSRRSKPNRSELGRAYTCASRRYNNTSAHLPASVRPRRPALLQKMWLVTAFRAWTCSQCRRSFSARKLPGRSRLRQRAGCMADPL